MFQIFKNYVQYSYYCLLLTKTDQLILTLASEGSRLIRPFNAGLLLAESKTCLMYLQKMFQIFKYYVLLSVITSTLTTASDWPVHIVMHGTVHINVHIQ